MAESLPSLVCLVQTQGYVVRFLPVHVSLFAFGYLMTDAPTYIFAFQLEQLKIENFPYDVAFHPHGIFLDRENQQLYVVNHAYAKGGERIDIFNVDSSPDFEQVKRGATFGQTLQLLYSPSNMNF